MSPPHEFGADAMMAPPAPWRHPSEFPPPRSSHATLPVPGESEWEAASPPHVKNTAPTLDAKNRNVPLCCIDTTTGHRTAGRWHPPICICNRFIYTLFIYVAPYYFLPLIYVGAVMAAERQVQRRGCLCAWCDGCRLRAGMGHSEPRPDLSGDTSDEGLHRGVGVRF